MATINLQNQYLCLINSSLLVNDRIKEMVAPVTGFSDPYCMLGIVPANAAHATSAGNNSGGSGSTGTPTRGSQKKKTPLENIPARYIKTTTVRNNTLDPVWNER